MGRRFLNLGFIFLNINALQPEFVALEKLDVEAAAAGAEEAAFIQSEFDAAVAAAKAGGDAAEVEAGTLGHGVAGEDVPIELDAVVHDAGELADDQVERDHAAGVMPGRMLQGDLQQALDDGKFVHGMVRE